MFYTHEMLSDVSERQLRGEEVCPNNTSNDLCPPNYKQSNRGKTKDKKSNKGGLKSSMAVGATTAANVDDDVGDSRRGGSCEVEGGSSASASLLPPNDRSRVDAVDADVNDDGGSKQRKLLRPTSPVVFAVHTLLRTTTLTIAVSICVSLLF